MFYDIFINGVKVETCGHPQIENLSLSLSGGDDGMFVFAGAVCSDNGAKVHYSWAQHSVELTDTITFSPSASVAASTPSKRFELGRTAHKAPPNVCSFCHRTQSEVKRLIVGNDDIPGICSDCVAKCEMLLSAPED